MRVLYNVIFSYVVSYNVMLCYDMLCWVMLCQTNRCPSEDQATCKKYYIEVVPSSSE